MEYSIRKIRPDEYDLLKDFTYEAIYVPEGVDKPGREIVELAELLPYYSNFASQEGDYAFVAEVDSKVVGAVWSRVMDSYGHIDYETPLLSISVLEGYRGFGIGTKLMDTILVELKVKGYSQVSLSVQKENFALKMYLNLGFEIYLDDGSDEYILLKKL